MKELSTITWRDTVSWRTCITCRYITDGRKNYTFSVTGEIRTIHDHIDCNSKNLIYMIYCLRCNKQYIGETKRWLKDRFNEHRRPVYRPPLPPHPLQFQTIFFPTIIHFISWRVTQSQGSVPYRKGSDSWTQRYKQTRRNLILCLTHLYLMYYNYSILSSCYSLVYFIGLFSIDVTRCTLISGWGELFSKWEN